MAFMVNGQKFVEYMAEQQETYRLAKERAKQERVSEQQWGEKMQGSQQAGQWLCQVSTGCGQVPCLALSWT